MADVETEIREAEDEINVKSKNMALLKGEFTFNLNKLKESFWPKVNPLHTAVFMSLEDQHALEVEIDWLETKVLAMEQQKGAFFELRDLGAAKKERFEQLNIRFQEAFLALEAVTKEELAVLRGYENPPQIVLDVMATVMALRGEDDQSWEGAKIMLSETYYYAFFISKARNRHKQDITEASMDALQRFLMNPDSVPELVSQVSIPCGAMAKWLRVLRDFYILQKITEPKNVTLEEVQEELMTLRKKLQSKKEDIAGAQEKLRLLEEELEAKCRELRDRYDETMTPLQDMFFEANARFNAAYCSPSRRQLEGIE